MESYLLFALWWHPPKPCNPKISCFELSSLPLLRQKGPHSFPGPFPLVFWRRLFGATRKPRVFPRRVHSKESLTFSVCFKLLLGKPKIRPNETSTTTSEKNKMRRLFQDRKPYKTTIKPHKTLLKNRPNLSRKNTWICLRTLKIIHI